MTEEIRQIAGRYRLLARIGGGAMGVVWKGEDRYLDRVVAVKELLMPHGQGEDKATEAKNRAMREARIAARLQHPHAISVFSVVEDGDRPWLIMEYLPSKSLAAVLQDDGSQSVAEVIRIACQLGSALAAAHRAGIVHRDVKPGNVLVGEDGTVKVTDFGISRAVGDVTLTATGEIAGTPAFLAPEVARGEDASFPSDVFSLGATLYTAVEGVPPFGYGDNAIALLYRVSSGEIVPPIRAGRLEPLLLRMLEVKPDDRPTMAAALLDLEALAVEDAAPRTLPAMAVPAPAPHPTSVAPVAEPVDGNTAPKRRMIFLLAGVVVLAALITGVLLMARDAGESGANPQPSTSALVPSTAPPVAPPVQSSAPPSPTTSAENVPRDLEKTVADYYGLMPNDLQAGYAKLSDTFKKTTSPTFQKYASFWHTIKSATASNVTAGSGHTVTADIVFVSTGGKTSHEHHVFTLVKQNGSWVIDTERN